MTEGVTGFSGEGSNDPPTQEYQQTPSPILMGNQSHGGGRILAPDADSPQQPGLCILCCMYCNGSGVKVAEPPPPPPPGLRGSAESPRGSGHLSAPFSPIPLLEGLPHTCPFSFLSCGLARMGCRLQETEPPSKQESCFRS